MIAECEEARFDAMMKHALGRQAFLTHTEEYWCNGAWKNKTKDTIWWCIHEWHDMISYLVISSHLFWSAMNAMIWYQIVTLNNMTWCSASLVVSSILSIDIAFADVCSFIAQNEVEPLSTAAHQCPVLFDTHSVLLYHCAESGRISFHGCILIPFLFDTYWAFAWLRFE